MTAAATTLPAIASHKTSILNGLYASGGAKLGFRCGDSLITLTNRWLNVICEDPESPYYNPDGCVGFYRALFQNRRGVQPAYITVEELRWVPVILGRNGWWQKAIESERVCVSDTRSEESAAKALMEVREKHAEHILHILRCAADGEDGVRDDSILNLSDP